MWFSPSSQLKLCDLLCLIMYIHLCLLDEEPPKPVFEKKELNWEEDMQMYSKFLDRKVGISEISIALCNFMTAGSLWCHRSSLRQTSWDK